MRCIICGEEKKPSKEHIIPDALGNKGLITYSVCETCNNLLGTNVDAYLVNHPLIKLIRERDHLTGKGDTEAHFLPQRTHGDDGRLYDLSSGFPKVIPIVKKTGQGWRVEAETVDEGLKAIDKKLKRKGKSLEDIQDRITIQKKQTSKPTFSISANIDMQKLYLSVSKIAYEYVFEALGRKYLSDPVAEFLTEELFAASRDNVKGCHFEELSNYIHWQYQLGLIILDNIKQGASSLGARHAIVLHSDQDHKLICEVLLFLEKAWSFTICVSKNADQYEKTRNGNSCIEFILKDGKTLSMDRIDEKKKWWHAEGNIPYQRKEFNEIITYLVYDCPSSTKHKKKLPKGSKKKYDVWYTPVSARGCSFRDRRITGNLLTTILVQIRRPMAFNKAYAVLPSSESIETEVQKRGFDSHLSDKYYDLMVYHTRDDMTDTEAIFYYIRNAFAHGSFEVVERNREQIYFLESSKDGKIKAQMRLKESTLERITELSRMTAREIKRLQKPKNKVI